MTTPVIQTLTDELLGEIEAYGCEQVSAMQAEALIAELRTLRAENAELRKDAGRLDWLADLNSPAQVMLPIQFVLDNIHSMRDAIDQCRTAMEQAK